MKDLKDQTRPANRPAVRSVSLQIRDYKVTVKVRTMVPQITVKRPSRSVLPVR